MHPKDKARIEAQKQNHTITLNDGTTEQWQHDAQISCPYCSKLSVWKRMCPLQHVDNALMHLCIACEALFVLQSATILETAHLVEERKRYTDEEILSVFAEVEQRTHARIGAMRALKQSWSKISS